MISDALTTINDVEILSTGKYSISAPGEVEFTTADLAAAVAAQQDPYVHSPRLKIGHTSDFGDGEPSFGKVTNMRLINEGHTLVGDYTGVPKWLAEIMPAAYPSRSIEGVRGAKTPDGKTHELVINAVALLGVVSPGVATLSDLAGLYEEQAPEGLSGEAVEAKIGGSNMSVVINAAVDVEEVRRSYYEQLSGDQEWWWIRAVELDPAALIVDDDAGSLHRVPFEISEGGVSFGESQEVQIEYVPADKVAAMNIAAGRGRKVAVYASRGDSRPESNDEEDQVELSNEQLTKLGLSDDATQEDVDGRLAELTDTPPEPTPEAQPEAEAEAEEAAPEQLTLASVDPATLEQMRQDAELGRQARRQQLDDHRDRSIRAAVEAGKFPPARAEHWRKLWDQDPDGTQATIASLSEGLIPVQENGVSAASDDVIADTGYDANWLSPQERSRVAAAGSDVIIQEGR